MPALQTPGEISPKTVCDLVEYAPDTGLLFWRPRPLECFSNEHAGRQWNARYAGKEAFTAVNAHGYLHGSIWKKTRLAHRVAWCVFFGDWPIGEIDHINSDKTDNRLINLRSVTRMENCQNLAVDVRNTSGVTGVHRHGAGWVAELTAGGSRVLRKKFSSLEEAALARRTAEKEHGFHPLHGRKASCG